MPLHALHLRNTTIHILLSEIQHTHFLLKIQLNTPTHIRVFFSKYNLLQHTKAHTYTYILLSEIAYVGTFLVAKTPCSQSRGPEFDPWAGN